MDRTNIVLAAALVVVVALGFALAPRDQSRRASGPVFAPFATELAAQVVIEKGAERLVLERTSGSAWALSQPAGFPLAPSRVERVLLEPLLALQRADRAASDGEGFGFEEGARVRVLDAAGNTLSSFDQARGPQAVGAGSFVRVGGAGDVFRAAALPLFDTSPNAWWDGRLVHADPSTVTGLVLEFPLDPNAPTAERRRIVFERNNAGGWNVDGVVSPAVVSIDRAVQELARLRLAAIVGEGVLPEHALDPGLLVFELTSRVRGEEPHVTRVVFGAADASGRIPTLSNVHAREFVVLVDPVAASAIVEPLGPFLGR
jgi:hypothetical protein